jgi:protein TonB
MKEFEFDQMLDAVLQESANPELPAGFHTRMEERLRADREMAMTTVQTRAVWGGDVSFATVLGRRDEGRSRGFWGAVLAHGCALALIALLVSQRVGMVATKPMEVTVLDAPVPPAPPQLRAMGGGGGQKGPTPVSKGNPPKFEKEPLLPPKAPVLEARLKVDPAIDVQPDLKMARNDSPNIGMANSPVVGMSMGNGNGSGLGSGNGNGLGPGSGGNTGGGVYRIGGGVSAPVLIYQPEPEFSEEARKAKVAGDVIVAIVVDAHGRAQRVHVVRGIGMGLDERAVEAVRQYRFKPAMKDGRPVDVEMNVDVNFQIF